MAKIALVCMYDTWALGTRLMTNALLADGHEVRVIHFKLPFGKPQPTFLANPLNYENIHLFECRTEIIQNAYNVDVNPWTYNELMSLGDFLEDYAPDVIGLSTRSVYAGLISDVIGQIKRVKGAVTVAGGHDASFRPELYASRMDFVCIGDGEFVIVDIARAAGNKDTLRSIDNLVWQDESGKLVRNRMRNADLNHDYFYYEDYRRARHYYVENNQIKESDPYLTDAQTGDHGNYYTMAGRGCAWMCSFCSAGNFYQIYTENSAEAKRRRNRQIPAVMAELKAAKAAGFKKIFFMDSFFVGATSHLFDFFEAYKREVGIPFFAQLLPSQVLSHPKLLGAAVDAGMSHTVVGIQSGSERVNLDIYGRKSTAEEILGLAGMVAEYDNLQLDYHIITHNPEETPEDYEMALRLVGDLPKRNAQLILQRLRPFPNTAISKIVTPERLKAMDRDLHDRQCLLLMLRFVASDEAFARIRSRFDSLDYQGLKDQYAALMQQPNDERGWSNLGMALKDTNDLKAASQAFDKALECEPTYWRALHGKGQLAAMIEQYDQALSFLDVALVNAPPGVNWAISEIQSARGVAAMKLGMHAKAAEAFSEAFSYTAPSNINKRAELGYFQALQLAQQGQLSEARDAWTRASAFFPRRDVPEQFTRLGDLLGCLEAAE